MDKQTRRIRMLNDTARVTMGIGCRLVQTEGINALPEKLQSDIRERVETYEDFTPDNDPHGEHDFGSFEIAGHKIFWKIDYYNQTMDGGSEDPSDAKQTLRVLTIMLAEEY